MSGLRLASIRIPGRLPGWSVGIVSGSGGSVALMPPGFGSVDTVIRDWGIARHEILAALPSAPNVPVGEVEFDAPLRRLDRDILCSPIGQPEIPGFFTKAPRTIIGPFDEIALDERVSERWGGGGALAVVIGKAGRSIAAEDALSHIFGYCLANDVSHGDPEHIGGWLKGKSVDGTMPLGPWIATADLFADPSMPEIECEVNGEAVGASVTLPATDIARLIAELSDGMTLEAGDVILLAAGARPVVRPGDEVVTRARGLGELRNRAGVVAVTSAASLAGAT